MVPDPVRTLAVMHIAEAGGPPQHVRPWLAALAKRGSLDVVAPAEGFVLDLYSEIGRTHVVRYAALTFPSNPIAFVKRCWDLAAETLRFVRLVRALRPNVVIVVTTVVPSALLACRLTRTPTIVYAAEILDRGGVRSWVGVAVVRWTERLASGITCVSRAVASQFTDRARTLTVIPPGVDPTKGHGDRNRFRETHGLTGAHPCIAVVANVTSGRGQDVLLRALPTLRDDLPDVHCVFAGRPLDRPADRAYLDALVQMAAELGVADRVTFLGFVDPVADVYAGADIVVNPVRVKEGFPTAAIEALAARTPVVAASAGAVPEVLRDGIDAVLVEPDDSDELAGAIATLWRDQSLRARIVESGEARVLEGYRERASVDAFCSFVDRVLKAHAGDGRSA
jgi:glycosyltransferase involved in cell wall biosynthesis